MGRRALAQCRPRPDDVRHGHAYSNEPNGGRKQGDLDGRSEHYQFMLYPVQGSMGACIMDAYLFVALICSIYLAGRIAAHRGRSFKTWACVAAVVGPLALPLIFLFPNLHRKNSDPA
jgi:hypothetical protein